MLGILIFTLFGKVYYLLALILVFGLLLFVFREKLKKILHWLMNAILIGISELVFAFVLLFIVNTWLIQTYEPDGKPMFTSTSPSGRFAVLAYPSPTFYFYFSLPGQGGDGPALFILKDNQTGKELQRQHVDFLWWAYTTVDWYGDHVSLSRGDGITWSLPSNELVK